MKKVFVVALAPPVCCFLLVWVFLVCPVLVWSQRPSVVNIGAVFTFDSVIGRAVKPAIEAAVSDVNDDPTILTATQLRLLMEDANCSVFIGSVGAFQAIENEVVAIIGPQSSGIAHMISEIANGLRVPLVSYAATDPTLSALQFPFFVRTTHSDSTQMAAIADLVDFYGWKKVIAIFVDDDYGRNGIASLDNELGKKMAKVSYKLPLRVEFNEKDIMDSLHQSKVFGPRVYVVHVNPDPRFKIFTVAKKLQMMTANYVWLATDWFSTTVDSLLPWERASLGAFQGIVGLRLHTPDSIKKRNFMLRWRRMQRKGLANSEMNTYGLQAYDTIWTVAYAVDKFIHEFNNITFSHNDKLLEGTTSTTQLSKLKVFDGGSNLLEKILKTNFTGLAGRVQFDQDQNIVSGGYDVINIHHMSVHNVGYWSNKSGFSLVPPEFRKDEENDFSRVDQILQNITWPGGKIEIPRGWVIADEEKPLRIGVPNRASFVGFVTQALDTHKIEGYCIDIFLEARKLVPYDVPYKFIPFGDGRSNPSYDELVKMVADGVFDAAVGDIAIVTNRMMMVDFSQPYVTTGLVILAPIKNTKQSAWVFLKPFSMELWLVTAASFVMIAVVIWCLEHKVNNDFRGPPRKQLVTMFMFSFSTLFKTNQETTMSALGRMVMVVWLFILMVITASYTANLTSILTVERLSSPVTGIDSLLASNWLIGYQVGSFAYRYLIESLNVPRSRLVSLKSPEEYESALRRGPNHGGVAAIIDELTYVELFLANRTNFGIVGQTFTRGGWGFAFQRKSPLAIDFSTAILKLSENGELQKIHKKWFCKLGCPGERRKRNDPNQLHVISFWGLYVLCATITLTAFLVFLLRTVCQFVRYKRRQAQSSPSTSSVASSDRCCQVLSSFLDFIDEKEEAIKKKFIECQNPPHRS